MLRFWVWFWLAAVDMYASIYFISTLGFFISGFCFEGRSQNKGIEREKESSFCSSSPHPQHITYFEICILFPFVQDVWIWLGFTCSYCRKWTLEENLSSEGGSQLEMLSVPGTWHPSKTNLSLEWGPSCHTLPRCRVLRGQCEGPLWFRVKEFLGKFAVEWELSFHHKPVFFSATSVQDCLVGSWPMCG